MKDVDENMLRLTEERDENVQAGERLHYDFMLTHPKDYTQTGRIGVLSKRTHTRFYSKDSLKRLHAHGERLIVCRRN